MSAVLTPRRTRRGRERDRDSGRSGARQESLFGAYAAPAATATAVPSAPPYEPESDVDRGGTAVATDAPAAISGPTLDEAISGLWGGLLAGDMATCPACGVAAMQPRHSAGAGVVGGRCGACEATLA
jgi:hypothetical protein